MNFVFHPEAEAELNDAIDYYEAIRFGLGSDFATEVYSSIQRAVFFPKAWPILADGVSRSLVKRFPYGVLYAEVRGTIQVVAVMHLHRQPDYWQKRQF